MATVFELLNPDRHEIYLAITLLPLEDQVARLRESPPDPIRDWAGQGFFLGQVESFPNEGIARRFMTHYARMIAGPFWKVIQ